MESKVVVINSCNQNRTSKFHWESEQNRKNFIDTLVERYGITNPNDWRSVSLSLFKKNGGSVIGNGYLT